MTPHRHRLLQAVAPLRGTARAAVAAEMAPPPLPPTATAAAAAQPSDDEEGGVEHVLDGDVKERCLRVLTGQLRASRGQRREAFQRKIEEVKEMKTPSDHHDHYNC